MAGAEARFTAQISALIIPEWRDEMDDIANARRLAFGDVIREVIEAGLPIVSQRSADAVARYAKRSKAERQLEEAEEAVRLAEEQRAARRG